MELPASITAIGEQLEADREIIPDPQLFAAADVFAAERQRLFLRPWVAVDHQSRLPEPGRFVRFEAATRSILVTRDTEDRTYALRNVCIHAGYPVCDAEEGAAERMVCPYHGWEFAIDGRLVEPDLSARIDLARLRLARYPLCLSDGLIFVDLSRAAPPPGEAPAPPPASNAVPLWLAKATVTSRERYAMQWNWKLALSFVRATPQLVADEPGAAVLTEFGPLSLIWSERDRATLLRVMPKSASHTDIAIVRMASPGASGRARNGGDRLADSLHAAADGHGATAPVLDRDFFGWYWSLMSAE